MYTHTHTHTHLIPCRAVERNPLTTGVPGFSALSSGTISKPLPQSLLSQLSLSCSGSSRQLLTNLLAFSLESCCSPHSLPVVCCFLSFCGFAVVAAETQLLMLHSAPKLESQIPGVKLQMIPECSPGERHRHTVFPASKAFLQADSGGSALRRQRQVDL
jgi:hypothetical protein